MALELSTPIRLRPVEPQPIVQRGQRALWLRDPLDLSDKRIVVPQQLTPLLTLIDGQRDGNALRASLAVRYGLALPESAMLNILSALDEAFLLDNDRSRAALRAALETFRSAPYRPAALAGGSYPRSASELSARLDSYLDALPAPRADKTPCRGLISPHIDYARGGATYAAGWRAATESAREAEVVILVGTDHYGGPGRITLTRQHYATPYGVLPTDQAAVAAAAEALGAEEAFAEELHHRSEHAIELSAVWLHHTRGGEPCELVPILCGAFDRLADEASERQLEERIRGLVDALQKVTGGRRVFVVASADLAHVGPAFGGRPHHHLEKALLRNADEEMLSTLSAGDPDAFLAHIRRDDNARHVCGVAPIYLTLRLLETAQGHLCAYDQCLADEAQTSWVSVCAMTFS